MPAATDDLTDRQRDVLRLLREGKNPTEIGRELGISSQGVQGHMRRLRQKGLAEPAASPRTVAPAANARTRGPAAPFDPASTIAAVQQAIADERAKLDRREAEINAEFERLRAEQQAITDARNELDKLSPPA